MIIGFCKNCKSRFRKRETKYLFCSLKCANGYNKNGLNYVRLPKHNCNLAEFIGICLGDGHASKYQVTVSLNSIADKNYITYVVKLAADLFPGSTMSVVERKNYNMVDIKVNSVIVTKFMKKNGVISNNKFIPKWIFKKSVYVKSCLRGLFDTEGSISFKTYKSKSGISLYKQLNFRNFNVGLMIFVRDNLLNLGFNPTKTLKGSLYLSNHQSINNFRKLIDFSNPKLSRRSLIETYKDFQEFTLN